MFIFIFQICNLLTGSRNRWKTDQEREGWGFGYGTSWGEGQSKISHKYFHKFCQLITLKKAEDLVLIQCVLIIVKELNSGNLVQLKLLLQHQIPTTTKLLNFISNIWITFSGWCNNSQAQRKWFRRRYFWADPFDYGWSGTFFYVVVV